MSYTKIDALRRLYEKLGGSDSWDGVNLITEAIDKVTEVATGGGGSSDFSTATVTITNSSESALSMADINNLVSITNGHLNTDSLVATAGETVPYEVVIYKNQPSLGYISTGNYVSSSGAVEYDVEEEVLSITGDCSIVIEGAGPG